MRRVAWVDDAQHVRKLVRQRVDGAVAEEWFDARGRPGEARLRLGSGGAASWRLVTYGKDGQETAVDAWRAAAPGRHAPRAHPGAIPARPSSATPAASGPGAGGGVSGG